MTQQPICTDNDGTSIYKCRHTAKLTGGKDAKFTGAFVPGVKAVYVMSNSLEAYAAEKQSRADYDEMEANCNTCKHLTRSNVGKVKGGFLYGTCAIKAVASAMQFHPHDAMNMGCWVGRKA